MTQINSEALKQMLQDGQDVFLLDVREPEEHAAFNIGGTLVPLGDIISSAEVIPLDIPVIVYCRKGIRSQIAIQRLEEKFGFINLVNLAGGMDAWVKCQ